MMPEEEIKKYINKVRVIIPYMKDIPYMKEEKDVKFYEGKLEALREVLEWVPEKKSGADKDGQKKDSKL